MTTIDLTPPVSDITMEQGQSITIPYAITRGGDPLDLTGYDLRLQVRRTLNDSTVLINCTLANGKLVWLDQANGTFKLVLAASDTSLIPFRSGEEAIDGVYDLELVTVTNVVFKAAKGAFIINREVTR